MTGHVRVCDFLTCIGAASSILLSSFSLAGVKVDCAGTAGPPAAAAAARS